jgi:hypothetical protein
MMARNLHYLDTRSMSHARRGKVLFIPGLKRERAAATAQRDRKSRWIVGGSILGGLTLFWGGMTLSRHEGSAGIRSLPTAERQWLYARTLNELSTVCRESAAAVGELRDHCLAQAHFVMALPECDDVCQRAAAAVLPHARR